MKNTLTDLNNILFEQIERINDDELKGDKLEEQLKKTKTVNDIAKTIVSNANLELQAIKHMDEYGYNRKKIMPSIIDGREERNE